MAAAGNNNSNQRSYPACYPGVISVGGTGSGSVLSGGSASNMTARASFSEFGQRQWMSSRQRLISSAPPFSV